MKQKKIFDDQLIVITGAAGFIGSCVVRYLNDKGLCNLLLVDDLKLENKWKNLVGKKFVDLVSKKDIFEYLKGKEREIEAFIHLGATTDTTEVNADYLLENNFRFSIRLAEYALENDHRFIYASSGATYGDGKKGFSDDHNLLDTLLPLNMYGYSKHLFDLWLKRNHLLDKVVGLKFFNVFGPNESHKKRMASMVYHIYHQIQKEGVAKLFRSTNPQFQDGEQKRDFIYVKDVVRMICLLLEDAFIEISGIYNIGRGEAVSWNLLVRAIFSALGKKTRIEYIDMPKDLIGQYQDYTCADMTKYRSIHPDFKTMSIEEAVSDYVQNYLAVDQRW